MIPSPPIEDPRSAWAGGLLYSRRVARNQELKRKYLSSLIATYGDNCAYCNKLGTELDHIFPFSLARLYPLGKWEINRFSNLALACRACNASKHNKLLIEWAEFSLDKANPEYEATLTLHLGLAKMVGAG